MQCLRAWRRRKEPGSQRFGKCQVNSLVDDWFFGGLSRKTQHFYHLLRNRSCHQQSFSSKILNITCYSCEEKLTFYRTLKRISHICYWYNQQTTPCKAEDMPNSNDIITQLHCNGWPSWMSTPVTQSHSFPNIPHPWCYDFKPKHLMNNSLHWHWTK